MIVRNESKVVKRCFDSLLPLINTWVIVDTGSTDGTQEVIREYFKEKGISGQLHERPWIDFATDRNFALELAQEKADYCLFIDADEIVYYHPGFTPPKLEAEFYYILAETGGMAFIRPFLAKTKLHWRWAGVVHESLYTDDKRSNDAFYPNVSLVSFPDGNRRQNPKKFHIDVEMLKKAYKKDPNNQRLLFYLGKSTLANKQHKAALYYFKKLIKNDKFSEDAYMCRMDMGTLYIFQKKPIGKIVHIYEEAAKFSPNRMEPYYMIAHLFRNRKEYEKAFEYAEKGIVKPTDEVGISVDKWIYQHGMHLEYMLAAYAIGKKELGKKAAETILARKDITQNIRNLIDRTLRALERGDMSPIETVK